MKKKIKTEYNPEKTQRYKTGIQGAYTVGGSRDKLSYYEDNKNFGINVYNCCGEFNIVTEK